MKEVVPKKSLGQHWLHDAATLQAICDSAELSLEDTVLEIGPGLGTLTSLLVAQSKSVIAVEFDHELAVGLPKLVPASNLEIIEQDILSLDLTKLPAGYKVVANIPYYLTSNLIRVLSESSNPPTTVVLLIQKEVAERVCAKPGSMSILSVTAQYYWEASLGQLVPAYLFTPPPKVDSQVLALHRHEWPLFEDIDTKKYFRLVKAGFGQKRKTLVNSLSAGLSISKDQAKTILDTADIAQNTRAQALSLEDWHRLYQASQTA